jgi:hypothetical protein
LHEHAIPLNFEELGLKAPARLPPVGIISSARRSQVHWFNPMIENGLTPHLLRAYLRYQRDSLAGFDSSWSMFSTRQTNHNSKPDRILLLGRWARLFSRTGKTLNILGS